MISLYASIGVFILGIVLVILGYLIQRYSRDGIIKAMGNAIWIVGIIVIIAGIIIIVI